MISPRTILGAGLIFLSALAHGADGKILGTPVVTQVEGTGGTGIVPWAVLAGYATDEQVAVTVFTTHVNLDDFGLKVYGGALSVADRLELSYAHQRIDVRPLGLDIEQSIFGAKLKLAGDLVYTSLPQISIGMLHKQLDDPAVANLLGAADDKGTDYYVAISRLNLGAVFGYNLLWNVTARATRANQNGLLGHGGDNNDDYELMLEGSAAVLLNRHLAFGVDLRDKPDNLSAVPEDRWLDVFVAYFPNKRINITAAWADLGNIAGLPDQRGAYVSITGYLQ